VLDIGFDAMVFLDDNPFEREVVRAHLPEVTVPDLPADPALYLDLLREENLFETASFSDEDRNRTALYLVEADRKQFRTVFTDEGSYLSGLEMECEAGPVNAFTLPRVAQLTQRSNQFNLRTVRYTEEELRKIVASDKMITLAFSLTDKFGDHGLISAVILEDRGDGTLFIDTWIMSCRVLKRKVEEFVLAEMVAVAREKGFGRITGEYIPTAKNGLVRDLFAALGFTEDRAGWHFDVGNFNAADNFIKKVPGKQTRNA
jgi:FkbH-like protein